MRRPGIEPGSTAWQAAILPLDHRRDLMEDDENKVMLYQTLAQPVTAGKDFGKNGAPGSARDRRLQEGEKLCVIDDT